ncbi:hypothetical protein HMPREF3039_01654 [Akkermansia sp. KLE1798]|nr:hypothetical protein HMPREF3039_01654 [Akkermansia sp. KLE1798]
MLHPVRKKDAGSSSSEPERLESLPRQVRRGCARFRKAGRTGRRPSLY